MNPYDALLNQLHLPQLTFLGEGMQCHVFADGPDRVIKIYPVSMGSENIHRLMTFYHSLKTNHVSFDLPEILEIRTVTDKILVTEKRLSGITPTLEQMRSMEVDDLKVYFHHYVDVLFELQNLTTTFLQKAEPLDRSGDFYEYGQYENWRQLLTLNLERKLMKSGVRFQPFISQYDWLIEKINKQVQNLELQHYHLIHGDYYPANTLMDESFNISAVLDFGTFTILGDPLFDIVLGWSFADMYQNVKHLQTKDFVGNLIRQRVTEEEHQRMKLYLLIYSLLSADIYASGDVNDGHFRWAMDNLNDDNLREVL